MDMAKYKLTVIDDDGVEDYRIGEFITAQFSNAFSLENNGELWLAENRNEDWSIRAKQNKQEEKG